MRKPWFKEALLLSLFVIVATVIMVCAQNSVSEGPALPEVLDESPALVAEEIVELPSIVLDVYSVNYSPPSVHMEMESIGLGDLTMLSESEYGAPVTLKMNLIFHGPGISLKKGLPDER